MLRGISSKKRNSNLAKEDDIKTVQVAIEFVRIGEIDTMNEKYQAEVHVESKWTEKNQIIDQYDPKLHWNPKLYIENALQEPKEQIRYDTDVENNDTIITEIRIVKGLFWERLELQNFPVDVQELSVILTTKLTRNEIKLVSDPQKLSFINFDATHTFIDQQKWRLFKLVKISETASYDLGSTSTLNDTSSDFRDIILAKNALKPPKIAATCYCSRRPGYYFFNAYFLIFLITVSALTIFSVDCKFPQNRLQTTYTLLLTSVSFKWVINRSLPTVSYLTSLDKYAIVCIFYVCLLCVWHGLVGTFWEKQLAQELDKWVLISFSIIFFIIQFSFGIWLYFAYGNIRRLKKQENEFLRNYKDEYKNDNLNKKNVTRI